jgi:hypothetical protein
MRFKDWPRDARNLRLIVRALEREVQAGADWSRGFLDRLSDVEPETARDVDELLSVVRAARRSGRTRAL